MDEAEVVAWTRYEIDCTCGDTFLVEDDPRGERIECPECGTPLHVIEVR